MLSQIEKLESDLVEGNTLPDLSIKPSNLLVQNEKEFEKTCLILESRGHQNAAQMSEKKFYEALKLYEKKG